MITRLWDKYLTSWRGTLVEPKRERDPEEEKRTLEQLKAMSESPDLTTHDERDIDKISYVKLERSVRISKGKYLRFSKEQIRRMEDAGEIH